MSEAGPRISDEIAIKHLHTIVKQLSREELELFAMLEICKNMFPVAIFGGMQTIAVPEGVLEELDPIASLALTRKASDLMEDLISKQVEGN